MMPWPRASPQPSPRSFASSWPRIVPASGRPETNVRTSGGVCSADLASGLRFPEVRPPLDNRAPPGNHAATHGTRQLPLRNDVERRSLHLDSLLRRDGGEARRVPASSAGADRAPRRPAKEGNHDHAARRQGRGGQPLLDEGARSVHVLRGLQPRAHVGQAHSHRRGAHRVLRRQGSPTEGLRRDPHPQQPELLVHLVRREARPNRCRPALGRVRPSARRRPAARPEICRRFRRGSRGPRHERTSRRVSSGSGLAHS